MKTNNIIFRMKGIQNEKQQYVAVTPPRIFFGKPSYNYLPKLTICKGIVQVDVDHYWLYLQYFI